MSPAVKHINGFAYIAAREHVEQDVDPNGVPSNLVAHQIHLTHRGVTCVVTVDHDTFMDPEFFRTLVLHQIEGAIEELAVSET